MEEEHLLCRFIPADRQFCADQEDQQSHCVPNHLFSVVDGGIFIIGGHCGGWPPPQSAARNG
jgi:hypothetical protein